MWIAMHSVFGRWKNGGLFWLTYAPSNIIIHVYDTATRPIRSGCAFHFEILMVRMLKFLALSQWCLSISLQKMFHQIFSNSVIFISRKQHQPADVVENDAITRRCLGAHKSGIQGIIMTSYVCISGVSQCSVWTPSISQVPMIVERSEDVHASGSVSQTWFSRRTRQHRVHVSVNTCAWYGVWDHTRSSSKLQIAYLTRWLYWSEAFARVVGLYIMPFISTGTFRKSPCN